MLLFGPEIRDEQSECPAGCHKGAPTVVERALVLSLVRLFFSDPKV